MSGYPLRKEKFIEALKEACDGIEIRYNAPVYLVGSYLAKGNSALDVDIVIVFTDEQLKRVLGPNYFGQNFSEKNFRFREKQKQWLWSHTPLHMWDFDFKEQSIESFNWNLGKTKYPLIERLGDYAEKCYLKEHEDRL